MTRVTPIMETPGLMIGGLIYYSGSLIINGELELNNFFFAAAMMLAYQLVRSLATLNMGIYQVFQLQENITYYRLGKY